MSKQKVTRDSSELAGDTYDLLKEIGVGVLATIDKTGSTHLTVVYYLVSEDFKIHFATKKKTKKHENLQANKVVQIASFDEGSQATVQIYGEATEVTDSVATQEIVEDVLWRQRDKEESTPPVAKLFAGDYVVYEITPSKITTAIFMRPERAGHNMFQTLDFSL